MNESTTTKRGRPPVTRERILDLIRQHGPASPKGIEAITDGEISRQRAWQVMKEAVAEGSLRELPLATGAYALAE